MATHTYMPMAAARQPFAPLNSSRLQNLTSLKNRQNAVPATLTSPGKRKANLLLEDDAENVDPIVFSPKRSKGTDGSSKSQLFLTPAPPSPNDLTSPLKPVQSARPILQARSPAPRINTKVSKPSPLSAPAGRSPTRKRIGILNRRRTSSPFTRVDPPRFAGSTGLGFSIDAALSGTIPAYSARQKQAAVAAAPPPAAVPAVLHEPVTKDSWFFEIHEDTEEELATNLMEHSTCTLDISSDEESAARLKDDRGKENVPPMDDISQTRTPLSAHPSETQSIKSSRQKVVDENAIDVDRSPLGEMLAEDFYAEGCDKESVVVIPAEAEVEPEQAPEQEQEPLAATDVVAAKEPAISVEVLMSKDSTEPAPVAALLQPMEKAEEGFELWESASAKGDDE